MSPAELDALEKRIRGMNAMAKIHRATRADVPIAAVLDVGGFDLDRAMEVKPSFLEPEYPFEWYGVYDLPAEGARLELNDGPDPTMSIVLLSLETATEEELRRAADKAMRLFSEPAKRAQPGEVVKAGAVHHELVLEGTGVKPFVLQVMRAGKFVLFTQHLPEELGTTARTLSERSSSLRARSSSSRSHARRVGHLGRHPHRAAGRRREAQRVALHSTSRAGADIFRMKGILDIHGQAERFVFQGGAHALRRPPARSLG